MSDDKNKPLKLERFGRYLILDHLVDGGMAKICRARFLGEQADKIVAIKMVQPQFSKDNNFKTMFMDEIKVAFGLLHPNIAQTYDYGLYREQLFTAMEYIDGANLKQFLDRLKDKNFVFPVEISCHIIAQVCQGLHYAHSFTDKLSGKPLNLVHRDISPHNIMLTYDGAIKVIDFGIAKAETNSEATQAGTIKGKLSYLAPEYLDGLSLDHRYDQFAVGITLWELLCSRKLFQAPNDLAVLKLIQACKIPAPSSINPNVPKELDRIVLKALSKDRTQRYDNMDKFNRDLVKFLYATYPDFNASDLSFFAKELFKEEIKRDKQKFLEYGKIDITSYMEDLKKELANGNGTGNAQAAPGVQAPAQVPGEANGNAAIRREIQLDLDNNTQSITLEKGDTTKVRRSTGTPDKTATSVKTKIPSQLKASGGGTTMTSRPKGLTTVKDKTKIGKIETKTESSKSGYVIILLVAGLAGVAYMNPEMVEEMTGISLSDNGANREVASVSEKGSREPKVEKKKQEGDLVLAGLDPYMDVYLNNEKILYTGVGIKIPFGKKYQLRIEKDGHDSFIVDFTLSKESPSQSITIPELKKARYGLLSTSNNYTEGSKLIIKVNGTEVEQTLPLENFRLPAGEYEGVVRDPLVGSEKPVKFLIEEDMKFRLD